MPSTPSQIRSLDPAKRDAIAVVIPVFDDWVPLEQLVPELDKVFEQRGYRLEIYLIDDGIDGTSRMSFNQSEFKSIDSMSVIELRRNLGHQRAITIGLAHVHSNTSHPVVVVMDADGEDLPADAVRLVETCENHGNKTVVFARRTRRSEGILFRFFYQLYQGLFHVLTGSTIRFGNFSAIPREALDRLIVVSEVWNHYAGGTLRSRLPIAEIETSRGRRLHGRSSMNFVSLVTHGLSAISVFGDRVGVRMLLAVGVLIILSLLGIAMVIAVRFFTELAIPGWATYVVAMLLIILMQAVSLSLFFIFIVLSNRNNASFLPARDYRMFIGQVRTIYKR